jgi:hypothetical protein
LSEHEQERYEGELRRTTPAPLPEQFMAQLQAAKPATEQARRTRPQSTREWLRLRRWLAPAMALMMVLLIGLEKLIPESGAVKKPLASAYGLQVDDVQVDHELVSSFDVVATLPGGQPVRFRCRKWRDQLVVTDKNRGVEIEQDSPRVEVMPVRFETY